MFSNEELIQKLNAQNVVLVQALITANDRLANLNMKLVEKINEQRGGK